MSEQNGREERIERDMQARDLREDRTLLGRAERDILNIEEAAELLGVSIKTFNKVLHAQDMPARKIGREWKFSRQALIEWVGNGRSREFYRDSHAGAENDESHVAHDVDRVDDKPRNRRTAGWQIEMD